MSKQLEKFIIPNSRDAVQSLNLDGFERMWANFNSEEDRDRLIDLINNNFYTDKQYSYCMKDGYHIIDNIPTESVRKGRESFHVEYRYNSDFFRSEHFTNVHDGLHIVFAGCSNTEGVGANIEKTWSHMLYSEISKRIKTSGYFNLGKGGSGWHIVIQNFQTYVDRFGRPDILFVLHPNILRDYEWEKDLGRWNYNQTDPVSKDTINNKDYIVNHRKHFMDWAVAWNLFLSYCSSIGTKVLWSTWDIYENQNIIDLGIFNDSYITIDDVSEELVKSMCPGGKCGDGYIEARDGHPGFLNQTNWYNGFWQELVDRGWIND
jgi:hypothetical protein